MKFSISTATARTALISLKDAGVDHIKNPLAKFPEVNDLANFSASVVGDEYVVELNDEVVLKYIGLVVKLSRLINSALELMSTDIEDLTKMIVARK